jgi:uncharacterized protein (TIGR00725 family)
VTDQIRKVVAVIGSREAPVELLAVAERVGRGVVDAGARIVTGGLTGIMEAASRGARSSAFWMEGSVVGVLPGSDAEAANGYVDIRIPTGMGHARNSIVVGMADVVIALGGGAGTLNEMAMAWDLGKPIIALADEGGWSERLSGVAIDSRRRDLVVGAEGSDGVLLALEALLRT